MPETHFRRTLRRGIALLLIPLALIVIEFGIHLQYQHGLVYSWVVNTSRTGSWVLIISAIGYLVVSGLRGFYSIAQENS